MKKVFRREKKYEKKKKGQFMQRVAAVILILCMIMGMLPSAITVEAHSTSDGYLYNVAAGVYIEDRWGFYQCECTSFVAWCLNSRNGVVFNNKYGGVRWGDAKNWGSAARSCGIVVDNNPAVGAVAWSSSGNYGHVAWVCAVNGDNVTIDEYNYGIVTINGKQHGNHKYSTRTVHKSAFQYIHFDTGSFISYMETPASGGNYSGSIRILGYALHKNGIRNVTAWVNGQSMDCPMYNSPDVAQVYPGYPTGNEGFQTWIPSSCLREGENEIEIYAYEHDNTPHLIAKHKFNWNSFVGTLESPIENGSYSGTLSIQGYALHKNGIRNVTAWVNNQVMNCPMYARPEIAEKYPGYPTGKEGFKTEIPISCLKNGENEILVYAYEGNNDPHNIVSYKFNYVLSEHTHNYTTEWKSDAENHWKECECGEKSENAAHQFSWVIDIAATESSTGLKHEECGTCGYKRNMDTVIEKLPSEHTHNYTTEWKSDAENHWRECECGEKSEEVAHGFTWIIDTAATEENEGIKHEECGTCGCKRNIGTVIEKLPATHTHDYGKAAWKSDAESHWKECECGEKSEEAAHGFTWIIDTAATEENEGIKHEECGTCGYKRNIGTVIEKLPATHTHDYGKAAWKSDAESHWKECECGEKSENAAHQFSWVIDIAATTEATGIKHEECGTCGYKRNMDTVIEKLPSEHTHNYTTEWKSDAENHWKECECGEKSDTSAHVFEWVIDRAATTEATGIKHEECGTCGYKRNMDTVIEKLPSEHTHNYTTEWKSDAENHWKECECGEKSDTAAHTEDGGSVTKAATETEKGVRTYKCSVCGYVIRTEDIEKLQPDTGGGSNGNNGDTGGNGNGNTNNGNPTPQNPVISSTDTNANPENGTAPGMENTLMNPSNGTVARSRTALDSGISTPAEGVKQPFIKDANSKIGWDMIRAEEEEAQEGNVINVDMNGSTMVPGHIFDSIKGKDITITFDMGDGIFWSVNGKSITANSVGNIDFYVKTGINSVPVDILNNVTGEGDSVQLSLSHEGKFGFTAMLSIGLGKENAGLTASLYYYNESREELEFISKDQIAADGMASLAFTHASDYVIVVDGEQEERDGVAKTEGTGVDKTMEDSNGAAESFRGMQSWRPWWIIVVILLIAIIGTGIVVWQGKKENSKQ